MLLKTSKILRSFVAGLLFGIVLSVGISCCKKPLYLLPESPEEAQLQLVECEELLNECDSELGVLKQDLINCLAEHG